jgi:2'-5' RNA ligase
MMSTMRLFVAVEPPAPALADLEGFLESRRDAGADLRWTSPASWHLTLAFMASAPDKVLEDLTDRLGEAARRSPLLRVAVAGGGCFPDVTRARVLWAGVDGGDAMAPLAKAVRSACSIVGAAPEGGPFHAHVTLARLPRPRNASRWVRVIETYAGPPWTVAHLALVESHLPREKGHRPRYEVLARVPLAEG